MIATVNGTATDLRSRVAAGDRAALGEAFERFRPLAIRAITKQRGGRSSEDEDILQEAFLRLPECARHCHPATNIEGCVVTAVHQARRDHRAARASIWRGYNGKPAAVVDVGPDAMLAIQAEQDGPEQALEQRERAHHLSELLERLPARSRAILLAREVHDLSTREIAALLDMRPSSVSTMLGIARGRLMQLAKSSPIADIFEAMPTGRGAWRRAAA